MLAFRYTSVVSIDSWPSQRSITERSTPCWRRSIATERRSTCIEMRFLASEGQLSRGNAVCDETQFGIIRDAALFALCRRRHKAQWLFANASFGAVGAAEAAGWRARGSADAESSGLWAQRHREEKRQRICRTPRLEWRVVGSG